jgi:hypothetical protein
MTVTTARRAITSQAPVEQRAKALCCTRGSNFDCEVCLLKPRCCPNTPARKIPRSVHESAREAARSLSDTEAYHRSRKDRKKVEMLFAHLKRI